jgi:hypothetical protein
MKSRSGLSAARATENCAPRIPGRPEDAVGANLRSTIVSQVQKTSQSVAERAQKENPGVRLHHRGR